MKSLMVVLLLSGCGTPGPMVHPSSQDRYSLMSGGSTMSLTVIQAGEPPNQAHRMIKCGENLENICLVK